MLLALVLATARCQGAVPPAPAASANAACQTERGFVDNTTLIPSVATNPISVCGADVKGFDRSRDHRHGGGHVSICVSAVSRSASGNGDGKCRTLRKNSAITPSGTSAAAVDAHPSAGAPPCGSGAHGLAPSPFERVGVPGGSDKYVLRPTISKNYRSGPAFGNMTELKNTLGEGTDVGCPALRRANLDTSASSGVTCKTVPLVTPRGAAGCGEARTSPSPIYYSRPPPRGPPVVHVAPQFTESSGARRDVLPGGRARRAEGCTTYRSLYESTGSPAARGHRRDRRQAWRREPTPTGRGTARAHATFALWTTSFTAPTERTVPGTMGPRTPLRRVSGVPAREAR